MAKARKPTPIPLNQVKPGDVFLMPLADGRFGVCRVLRTGPDNSQVLVAASPWVGVQATDLNDPQMGAILSNRRQAWQGELEVRWVSDPVPETFLRLGQILPSSEEEALTSNAFGSWLGLPTAVFAQWRWDHEREAVLAEMEAERQKQQTTREDYRRAYKPLPAQTLEEFRHQKAFAGWSGYVESHLLRASRRIIRDAVDALIELGPDAPGPAKLDVFRLCVERFNDLDGEDQFINTIEREDICELLDNLAALVDLDDYDEDLTGNRDW